VVSKALVGDVSTLVVTAIPDEVPTKAIEGPDATFMLTRGQNIEAVITADSPNAELPANGSGSTNLLPITSALLALASGTVLMTPPQLTSPVCVPTGVVCTHTEDSTTRRPNHQRTANSCSAPEIAPTQAQV
jgi:hypothetical protein